MLRHKILSTLFVLASLSGSVPASAELNLTNEINLESLRPRPRRCEDIGWSTNNRIRQCVAGYRNNDRRFNDDVYRYGLRNCYVHRDGSGDRFYFCDMGHGGGYPPPGGGYPPPGGGYPPPGGGYPPPGGGYPPPGGGYPPPHARTCASVGWSDNYRRRDCAAPYRNNDRRFYDDAQRYRLRNCMIHTDSSGDRFYFCDLDRNR